MNILFQHENIKIYIFKRPGGSLTYLITADIIKLYALFISVNVMERKKSERDE